ncbi:MAG: tRNA (guanosine(46)-N7)-methyltransferase TrmB [Bacteroidales bacterium]|jgi:tRNA (guanine-N7-)-methyltransferase|nr:tRNA (guanosine(46)-N7)-methyltransferase TrmB [Bacteroidales bacterium]
MSKKKLARFAENLTFANLFQHTQFDMTKEKFPLWGKWRHNYFHNDNPIVLELGCGKGEYTVALAQRMPDKNYIGIDRKGARLWRGCKDALELQLFNVAFIRTQIAQIEYYFAENEVDEIWVTFPDPQPKKEWHRLVSPNYVHSYYKKILKPEAIIHLKTDSRMLYEYLLKEITAEKWQLITNIEDVYKTDDKLLTEIQTFYEKHWLDSSETISYIAFQLMKTESI